MFLEEDVLETVSSVRRTLPSSLGLISAVLKDDWVFIGINRNLVENISVVAVNLLSFRTEKVVFRECSLFQNYRTTDCKTPLCFKFERCSDSCRTED